jgi:hypothetical protein
MNVAYSFERLAGRYSHNYFNFISFRRQRFSLQLVLDLLYAVRSVWVILYVMICPCFIHGCIQSGPLNRLKVNLNLSVIMIQ